MQGQESYHQPERSTQESSAPWVVSYGELGRIKEQVESCKDKLDDLQGIFSKLIGLIETAHREVKDASMVCLGLLFRKGHSDGFLQCPGAAAALVAYFNMLSRELHALELDDLPHEPSTVEGRMLGVLSLFGQLLHEHPSWSLPLTRRFALNLFMLSPQLVAASPLKQEITKVLSVIWLSVSRSTKFLRETSLVSRFKQLLLESYRLVCDSRVLARLNTALRNMMAQCPLTLQQAKRYELLPVMTRFSTEEQLRKAKVALKLRAVSGVFHKDSVNSK